MFFVWECVLFLECVLLLNSVLLLGIFFGGMFFIARMCSLTKLCSPVGDSRALEPDCGQRPVFIYLSVGDSSALEPNCGQRPRHSVLRQHHQDLGHRAQRYEYVYYNESLNVFSCKNGSYDKTIKIWDMEYDCLRMYVSVSTYVSLPVPGSETESVSVYL